MKCGSHELFLLSGKADALGPWPNKFANVSDRIKERCPVDPILSGLDQDRSEAEIPGVVRTTPRVQGQIPVDPA